MNNRAKKYLLTSVIACLIVLTLAMGINFIIDPAHLFGGGTYESNVATLLSRGAYVKTESNFDNRLLKKFLIERLTTAPDVVIFGSSRALEWGGQLFGGKRVLNLSVIEGRLEDDLALYQSLVSNGKEPKAVLLALDPWILNGANRVILWQSIKNELAAMTRELDVSCLAITPDENRLVQLLSLDYLSESLSALPQKWEKKDAPVESPDDQGEGMAWRPDGSVKFPREFTNVAPERLLKLAQLMATKPHAPIASFETTDPCLKKTLSAFLIWLQKRGVAVAIFLPPYHPESYRIIATTPAQSGVLQAEAAIRALANQHGIPIAGSYDPELAHCEAKEFYDWHHFAPSCALKSLRAIDVLN